MAEHDIIDFQASRAPRPASRRGFPHVVLIDGITLDGDVVRLYSSGGTALADDLDDGFINAATVAAVTAAWNNGAADVYVGKVNTAGMQTYVQAKAAVEAAGIKGYFWNIDSRADAVVSAFGVAMEATKGIFIGQTLSADALTTGFPAGLSTLAGMERTALCWHDTAAQWYDVALTGGSGSPSPDRFSPEWRRRLTGVASYATDLTDAQAAFAKGNDFNLLLPLENQTLFFSADGVNLAGRKIYEIVTEDWLNFRVREDVAAEVLRLTTDLNKKFPLDEEGQGIIEGIIQARFDQGAGTHFKPGQLYFEPYELTPADIDAGKVRAFKAYITLLSSATTIEIPVVFTREDVVFEEI